MAPLLAVRLPPLAKSLSAAPEAVNFHTFWAVALPASPPARMRAVGLDQHRPDHAAAAGADDLAGAVEAGVQGAGGGEAGEGVVVGGAGLAGAGGDDVPPGPGLTA